MPSIPDQFHPVSERTRDRALFETNLQIWKANLPPLADLLQNITLPASQLISDGAQGFDIYHNGRPLLNGRCDQWARQFINAFWNSTNVFRVVHGPIQIPEDLRVEREAIEQMKVDAEINLTAPLGQAVNQIETFHLVLFGIGLAEQIPLIIDASGCRNLVLVEPNAEFLLHSLYTFDWQKVFKIFQDERFKLTIICDTNPELVFFALAEAITSFAPTFTDGLTIIQSYEDELTNLVSAETIKRAGELVGAAGWFDDECDMVRNAYHNLKGYSGPTYLRRDNIAPYPAFIVGSGPSLDNCFDTLRNYQDHAIVISCGTTIRLLLREGIKPDFHVEMENTPEIKELCETVSNTYDLSEVTLIASNTINPGVAKSFGKTVYFFRSHLASTPIFSLGEDRNINNSSPTVANLGLSFSQEFGCREFYLFGVDFGTRDILKHHAKGSAYESEEVLFEDKLDIPCRANFCGEDIWSDSVFVLGKHMLESAIDLYRFGRHYFNCSDGVRIEGMTPILPDTISIKLHAGKHEYIENVVSSFPAYTPALFKDAWTKADLRTKITELRDQLLAELNAPKSRSIIELMADMLAIVSPSRTTLMAENHFYRGSLFHTLGAMVYYTNRVHSAEDLSIMTDIGKRAISKQIQDIADQVIALCDQLEAKVG